MSAAASPLIRLHANDNVLVARRLIGLGETLPPFGLRTRAQVPVTVHLDPAPTREIRYHLRRDGPGWRVDDIAYPSGTRLRCLLADRPDCRPGRIQRSGRS